MGYDAHGCSRRMSIMAVEIRERIYHDRKHPYLSQSYNNLSIIYVRKKQLKKALKWQLKVYFGRLESKNPDILLNNLEEALVAIDSALLIEENFSFRLPDFERECKILREKITAKT